MRAAPKRGAVEKLRLESPARSRHPSAQDDSAAPQVTLRFSQLGKYVYVVGLTARPRRSSRGVLGRLILLALFNCDVSMHVGYDALRQIVRFDLPF